MNSSNKVWFRIGSLRDSIGFGCTNNACWWHGHTNMYSRRWSRKVVPGTDYPSSVITLLTHLATGKEYLNQSTSFVHVLWIEELSSIHGKRKMETADHAQDSSGHGEFQILDIDKDSVSNSKEK